MKYVCHGNIILNKCNNFMRKPLRRQLTNTLLSRGLACLTNYDIFFSLPV